MRLLASDAAEAMTAYLQEHLRRYEGEDTFLSQLLTATREETLDEDDLLGNLVFLFVAGHETTTNLLGNGLLALLCHPKQLARLREEQQLMTTAVEGSQYFFQGLWR